MDIIPTLIKDDLQNVQIEQLQKKQIEYKLVDKVKRNAGHILFSFNRKTGEIKRASINYKTSIGLDGKPIYKSETVLDPDCYYEQALNEKNFIKRLKRNGLLK